MITFGREFPTSCRPARRAAEFLGSFEKTPKRKAPLISRTPRGKAAELERETLTRANCFDGMEVGPEPPAGEVGSNTFGASRHIRGSEQMSDTQYMG